jgi:integrase
MKTIITDKFLRALADKGGPRPPIWDSQLRGFGVRVGKRTLSFFAVRRQRKGNGKPIRIACGVYPLVTLADARVRAMEAMRDLATGIDPREKAKAEAAKQQNTFAVVAEIFIERDATRKRTARAIELLIRRELIPRWGDKQISDVSRADVVALIDEIVDRGHEAAAHQTFGYTKRLFNWALSRGTFGLEHSPFDRLKRGDLIGARRSRDRLLSPAELRLIWQATEGAPTEVYPWGQYIRLLLLCGVRRNELARARWSEFDLDAATWIVPGGPLGRMKNGDDFLVALPDAAVTLLKELPRLEGPYVFTARGNQAFNDFTGLKRRLDARITALNGGQPIPHWTLHDTRRCVRTNLAALRIPHDIAELLLAHRQPTLVRTYNLHSHESEKREALAAWATRLLSIVTPPLDNVVPLRQAS